MGESHGGWAKKWGWRLSQNLGSSGGSTGKLTSSKIGDWFNSQGEFLEAEVVGEGRETRLVPRGWSPCESYRPEAIKLLSKVACSCALSLLPLLPSFLESGPLEKRKEKWVGRNSWYIQEHNWPPSLSSGPHFSLLQHPFLLCKLLTGDL